MPDFFVWSKILPSLIYPLPLIILLIFLLSWLIRDRAIWFIRCFCLVLWIVSTPVFSNWFSSQWESPLGPPLEPSEHFDVAIVLGGLSDGGWSNPGFLNFGAAADRLTEAVALWKEGRVDHVLITSGSGNLLRPEAVEAPGLAEWARRIGIPESALFVEAKSRNTFENSRFSLPVVQRQRWKSVLLVTSAAHMPRSLAIFKKAGWQSPSLSLRPFAVDSGRMMADAPLSWIPEPAALAQVSLVIKERIGWIVYRWKGYL